MERVYKLSHLLGQGQCLPKQRLLEELGVSFATLKRDFMHLRDRMNQPVVFDRQQREVSPQRLIHYRDNWYLDAWCYLRRALRSFSVDAIRAVRVLDRDAIEPELERHFHPDSYGYRPGKSAHDALGVTRRRCWRHDWVLEYDIVGFFKPRDAKNSRGQVFMSFLPAISAKSATRVRQTMRSWKLQLKSGTTLNELARQINPTVRGWMNYYGAFYKSALGPVLRHLDDKLVDWATRKHKRLSGTVGAPGRG